MQYKIKLLLFSLVIFTGTECRSGDNQTEIIWDHYGVPHIYAESEEQMYYGFGWAQMQSHADLILRLYGQARGRAAEYWGEEFLGSDTKIHTFNLPERAKQAVVNQGTPYSDYLSAFVKGMNDFARENSETIGENYRKVLPVKEEDVMAHVLRVICLEFIAGEDLNAIRNIPEFGSNAYAIAPGRSASGNAMLVTNPHLPWYDYFLWFEAHLVSKDFNAYGITLVGAPTLSMAFNKHLGWAFTVNTMDGADRYALSQKRNGYLFDGKVLPFEKREVKLKVLQKDGSFKDVFLKLKSSVHGPVLMSDGNQATAVRMVGLNNQKVLEQYHKMAGSTNRLEFEEALKMMQNPMFNILYADREGNIEYFFNGNIPVRQTGDFSTWRGVMDGSKSEYLWNSIHTWEDLPKLSNPATGFLQNCNDPPWVCTYPPILKPTDYPAYMAPLYVPFRPQRSVNMIKNDHSISFYELIEYKLNTGMETADRFLSELLEAAGTSDDSLIRQAAGVLKDWDRKTENESSGAVLFAAWMDRVKPGMFETGWDPENPVETPRGLKDKAKALEVLSEASKEVIKKYGDLAVPWGDVYRYRFGEHDYPANGGPGDYGIYRTIYFMDDTDHKKKAIAGDTYIAVIEFSEPIKAMVLLAYGNASQPGNRHIGDQLKLMSDKRLRPALLEKNDIIQNKEKHEFLRME